MLRQPDTARTLLCAAGVRFSGEPALTSRVLHTLDAAVDGQPDVAPARWIDVAVERGASAVGGRHVLAQPPVDIALDETDAPIVRAGGVTATLGSRPVLYLDEGADQRMLRGVLDAMWPLLLPRFGIVHVHGGAVEDPGGLGWLLANDAGAGKSTTVLSLALEGWGWSSDDATYISRDGDALVAEGWPEVPRLSARSAAALRLSREDQASVYKTAVALPPAVTAARRSRVVLHRLLLPELGGVTRLERVEPRAALETLLRASAWLVCLPRIADAYLRLLADVAALPAWRLQLGPELLESPADVARLLRELTT